jgi:predicted nucleic acid-binding protein
MTTVTSNTLHFVDTNVWLYALISGQDATKATKARQLLATIHNTTIVSVQVINELCVNLIKREGFTPQQTRDLILDYYARYIVIESDCLLLINATELRDRYNISYWDSLIVASALRSGAAILYSEDMHHGLVVERQLTIENPFV